MLNRDSIVWTLGLLAAVLGFASGHMPSIVADAGLREQLKDLSALAFFVCGLMKASPAPMTGSVDQAWNVKSIFHLKD